VPSLLCQPADILRRVVGVQPHHVWSWRHQLTYGTIVEPRVEPKRKPPYARCRLNSTGCSGGLLMDLSTIIISVTW
jgi:hypothetical protein